MQEFKVFPESTNLRLDVFLSRNGPGVSRAKIQKLISAGAVSVNGKATRKKRVLVPGDVVRFDPAALPADEAAPLPQDIPLSILFEDDYYIAVDKPAGLVVHPGCGNRSGTLVNALLFHRGKSLSKGSAADRPGIVHRLDKDTSGVIVAAKTDEAHAALAAVFASRGVQKKYLAFCIGRPLTGAGIIEMPLARSRCDPARRVPAASGKSSTTGFRLLDFRGGISFIEFSPRTGRTHQIRVHCASSGFPVIADALYGGGIMRLRQTSPADRPFATVLFKCFSRQALHASSLTFIHPFLNRGVTVEAPLPRDFMGALALMRGETAVR
jgi:23S rRNA pseudouridine1911/1915/1917 synthase